MSDHRWVDHTSEVQLEVAAESLAGLAAEAGRALGLLMLRAEPAAVSGPARTGAAGGGQGMRGGWHRVDPAGVEGLRYSVDDGSDKSRNQAGNEAYVIRVNFKEAEERLGTLIEEAAAGQEVVITGTGGSVVRLVPVPGGESAQSVSTKTVGHALDRFLGTWTAEQEAELLQAVEIFERVDDSFWQ
jgi:antitoxin (DNA-binding transcriptional repressor) of toxin-antitoxin stability system